MERSTYLIDSNSFITSHQNYYPFDFAKRFWEQMEEHIRSGEIVILDVVRDEILCGNDNLSTWMRSIDIQPLDHREEAILMNYAHILQYIQGQKCYRTSALHEWSRASVADPWIIAAAMAHNHTIVTFETSNNNLTGKQPSKKVKIPDVASVFKAKVLTLFQMMRELGFRL